MAAPVKDYRMPADKQRLTDYIRVRGRRWIILNNSGAVHQLHYLHPGPAQNAGWKE